MADQVKSDSQKKFDRKLSKVMNAARKMVADFSDQLAEIPELQIYLDNDLNAKAYAVVAKVICDTWEKDDQAAKAIMEVREAILCKDQGKAKQSLSAYFADLKV